jgi:hypothetical protein
VRKVRPRFRLQLALSADEAVRRIEQRLGRPECPFVGTVAAGHRIVELRLPERDRHTWSPVLSVTLLEAESGRGSVAHGLVGPGPGVWTMFAMTYMGLLTAIGFVGIFGLVQWSLDLRPWGLYVVPGLVLAAAAMYGVARVGQRLAAPQTVLLRRFLEETLDVPESARAITEHDPYHQRSAGA